MRLYALFQKNPTTWWCKTICWWTGGPYFHAALLFQDDPVVFPKPVVGEALETGVRWVFPKMPLDAQHWDQVPIKATPEQILKLRAWIDNELGCGYDWFGMLLVQVLGIKYRSKNRWYCSELVAAGLQELGILTDADPVALNPNDLHELLV